MRKKNLLAYVFAVVLMWCYSMNVCAGNATPIIIDGDIYTWSQTVDVQVEKKANKGVHFTGSALESEELYNYAAISALFEGAYAERVYKNDYAAITLKVENTKDVPVSLNISFVDKANNQLVMKEHAYVLKETKDEKVAEKVNFASFEIEGGFQGKVTVPLSMMENSDKNSKEFNYAELTSWSVGILIEGNKTVEFDLKGLVWQDQQYLNQYEKSFGSYIDGDETVQIPEHGESISFYQITSDKDHTYQFVTDNFAEGISIDENGKLILDTTVEEQELSIQAMDESGVMISKKVALVNSWRMCNEKVFFYGPDELEKIEYPFDEVKESHIVAMRTILLIGCAIVFISYVVFFAKYQYDKKREEK